MPHQNEHSVQKDEYQGGQAQDPSVISRSSLSTLPWPKWRLDHWETVTLRNEGLIFSFYSVERSRSWVSEPSSEYTTCVLILLYMCPHTGLLLMGRRVSEPSTEAHGQIPWPSRVLYLCHSVYITYNTYIYMSSYFYTILYVRTVCCPSASSCKRSLSSHLASLLTTASRSARA
jgi:hypothetical protein